jgi:hypothetical protein
VIITLALLASAGAADPPAAELRALATGRYVLAEAPPAYEPRLNAAVERGMASLPFFIRPLARAKLRPAVYETVCSVVTIALDGERLQVSCGGAQAPFSRRLDGTDGPLIDDGDAYDVEVLLTDHAVGLRFSGDSGGQANTYAFEPDGSMTLRSSIFSRFLPDDLSWSLRYRREGAME